MTQQSTEQQQTGQADQQTGQQQTGQQTGQQQSEPQFITREQLNEALANVGGPRRTHTSQQQGQQQQQTGGDFQSVLDAINAQPERIVNSIREAFQPPKDDSKETQAATQAKVEAGQAQESQQAAPPKTRQQKFRDWWVGDNA